MRILFLSHYYRPEVNAPANRVGQLARAWAADGHDITVLTGFPNHPTGIVPSAYCGRPYIRHEIDHGVHVARTPIYAAANKGILRRSLNYASYSLSAATIGPFITARPDIVVATSPQFLTAVAGYAVARMKRVPFVLEVRDLWPASIVDVGAMHPGSSVVRALEAAERFLYRHADHIVVVTDSFVDAIAAHGIPRDKISVVKNGVDLEMFRPGPTEGGVRERLGLRDKFVAAYIGTHGMAHGLGTILEAASLLRHDDRYRFLLIGDGAEKRGLQQRAASQGLTNVLFLDQLPHEAIPDHVRAADVTLVLLRDRALFRSVIPSKIFEFMGTARPVVIGVDGEARRLVEAAGAGVFVPPEDAATLAATLRRLDSDATARSRMGQSGRDFVERHFSRQAQARLYLENLDRIISRVRLRRMALAAPAARPAHPE
jgi:glycosyltransferase involved in cell wall biosynthesis